MDKNSVFQILSYSFGAIGVVISALIGFYAHRQKLELEKEKENHRQLEEFAKSKLEDVDKLVEKFHSFHGLKSLAEFFKDKKPEEINNIFEKLFDAVEHIKSDAQRQESLARLIAGALLDEPTLRIHANIEDNHLLVGRFRENRDSKIFLRKHFSKFSDVQRVIATHNSIFIESGSTLSYVLLAIIDNYETLRPDRKERPLQICTNNIIVYILLLFVKHINPLLLKGDPTNVYGATFGKEHANDECDESAVIAFLKQNKVTALFTTASFLDIKYGPHVGSATNHKIKRILFQYAHDHNCENFFVIAAEKVNNDVETKKQLKPECKLIFDPDGTFVHAAKLPNEPVMQKWERFMSRQTNFLVFGSDKLKLPYYRQFFGETHQDGKLVLVKGGSRQAGSRPG